MLIVICSADGLVEAMTTRKQSYLSHSPQSSSHSSNLPKRKVHSQWDCSRGLSKLHQTRDILLKTSNLRDLTDLKVKICPQDKVAKQDRLRLNSLNKLDRTLRLKVLDKGVKTNPKGKVKASKVSQQPNKLNQ